MEFELIVSVRIIHKLPANCSDFPSELYYRAEAVTVFEVVIHKHSILYTDKTHYHQSELLCNDYVLVKSCAFSAMLPPRRFWTRSGERLES